MSNNGLWSLEKYQTIEKCAEENNLDYIDLNLSSAAT